MTGKKTSKMNQVFRQWPRGTVMTQTMLDQLDVSSRLANWHVGSGWLVRFGSRAFVQPGDKVDWRGGLYALQTQLGMSVHVDARTALELQGLSHFIPLGQQKRVILISDHLERLPAWFQNHSWEVKLEHHCLSLFKRTSAKASVKLDCGGFDIGMSSPERAIMEHMSFVKTNDGVKQAYHLMEGLATLRPDLVQDLLVNCRSVKVKRLFLWSAENVGHAWFERLDVAQVDLGKGKRQLYKGGQLDPKYQLTVPTKEEL